VAGITLAGAGAEVAFQSASVLAAIGAAVAKEPSIVQKASALSCGGLGTVMLTRA
jgi:hypothetical protein